ncbi:hypothetical protein OMF40_07070 [Bordetella pertussis]
MRIDGADLHARHLAVEERRHDPHQAGARVVVEFAHHPVAALAHQAALGLHRRVAIGVLIVGLQLVVARHGAGPWRGAHRAASQPHHPRNRGNPCNAHDFSR